MPQCQISDHALTLIGANLLKNVKILNLEQNQLGQMACAVFAPTSLTRYK